MNIFKSHIEPPLSRRYAGGIYVNECLQNRLRRSTGHRKLIEPCTGFGQSDSRLLVMSLINHDTAP